VWVYEHAIDFDGLRRFHRNLGNGLLGRRIERSPLPFARHRWVVDRGPSDIDIAECARPRTELSDWADERSQLPTDPESGSGWHLGVLPLTDGSTAVSLVVSHYLLDGLGLAIAIADAVLGHTRDLGLPLPQSRTRLRTAAMDARELAQDVPEVAQALRAVADLARRHRQDLVAAARAARRHRHDLVRSPVSSSPVAPGGGDGDEAVVVPGITIYIDVVDWDARSKALGGTSDTLLAGFAAKLAERMGRRRASDGAVTLQLPRSDRAEDDTRAIALSFARVSIDPTRVTTDLRDVRTAVDQALSTLREAPDASSHSVMPPAALGIVWLTQFAPKRALRRLSDLIFGDPDLPVFCSNLGDFGMLMCRLDGTDAEYVTTRGASNVTRQWLERAGGLMHLQCGRIGSKIGISVVAYQPGAANTKPALRDLAARTLAEFDLTGEIG
jgi:polyketide synthase 5